MQLLGERTREARERRVMSQQQLGDAIGLSEHAVEQWERHMAGVGGDDVESLAAALGVDARWLLHGEQGPEDRNHDLGDIYYTDDYPGEGCKVEVQVINGRYRMRVYMPGGERLESYTPVDRPSDIGRMIEEWCDGKVPRYMWR